MIDFLLPTALIALGALIFLFLKPGYEIVPHEGRLVIYRLGHFSRIAGPGMVWLLRSVDTVRRRYSVRNEPQDCLIDGLLVYGVPIGLTLNVWWSYDPQRAATGDKTKLADLALFEESERRNHLAVKLRDALVRQINALEQRQPLSPTATVVDKIVPILPGVPACVEILRGAQQELVYAMPALGIFLDASQPIVITRLHPPEDMIKGFSRGRVHDLLRMQFSDLPDSMMVHMLESIEGLDPLRVHEIRQVGNPGGAAAETRWIDDDGTLFRVPLGAGPLPSSGRPPNQGEPAAAPSAPADSLRLSPSDLALLKRVPRETHEQRRAA